MKSIEAGALVNAQVRLVRRVGEGGMGEVWIARHERLNTEVAVKLLLCAESDKLSFRARFEREAALAARVKSPHVVTVHDAGVSEEVGPYIVMELLEGQDLGERLSGGTELPLATAVEITRQVAEALGAAHQVSVVHRDIKPGNIFLRRLPGDAIAVKVLDFGIARDVEANVTRAGAVLGTPTYMSPEQLMGREDLDGRSDLYSLALVFYRCIIGKVAVNAASLQAMDVGALRMGLPRLRDARPELPAALDAWFSRATSFEVADRFPTANVFSEALLFAANDADKSIPGAAVPSPQERTVPEGDGPDVVPSPVHDRAALTRTEMAGASEVAPAWAPGRTGWVIGGVVAAVAVALVVSRAKDQTRTAPNAPSANVSAAAPAASASSSVGPLQVTVVTDKSGLYRARGQAMFDGAKTAVHVINAAGGVRGRKVDLVSIDDQGDTGPAFLSLMRNAASAPQGLRVLLGPTHTEQLRVWMAEPASRSVVTVVSSVTGILPEIDDKALLVRMAPSDAAQARALGKVLGGREPRTPACKGIAVVSAEGAWGQGFAGALHAELDGAGVRAVARVRVPMTPKRSYAEELAQVAAAKADCEVLLVPAAVAARYLVDAGRRPGLRVFAGDTVANGDFLLKARIDRADPKAGSVADGVRGVHFARPADSRPERRFFVRKYREVAGADPIEDFAATQFDAVVVLALALERNGAEVSPQALRDTMNALTHGKIAFGPEDLDLAMQHARRGEDVDYRGASGDVDDQGNGAFVTFGIEGGVLTDLAPVP